MPGSTEYIESYFDKTLSSEEQKAFELKCETDTAFANEVAIYITTRQALHEALLEQKMQQWKEVSAEQEEVPVIPIHKRSIFTRWTMYAAAACLVLVASVFLFERNTSPRFVASNYVEKNYSNISQQMSADTDKITMGIDAYNKKDYDKALQLFKEAEEINPANSDAKKYVGLTYFQQKNYDAALQQFDELSKMQLFSNPGDFLKAVTLLGRNKTGDKKDAKALLEKVKNKNEEESTEASELLKKF